MLRTRGQFNKEIQVYFTSRTLVLQIHTTFEFNKSLYKFLLQASSLHFNTMVFYGIQFLQVETLDVHSANCKKVCVFLY